MKAPYNQNAAGTSEIPRLAPFTAMGVETLQRIKTTLTILLTVLCGILANTSAFGQSIYIWTNQTPLLLSSGDTLQSTNWSPNGVPRPDVTDTVTFGDEMQFNGQTTGPLAVTENGGVQVNGGGSGQPYGLRIHLTANQIGSVTFQSPVAVSGGMRMNSFLVDAGAGPLIIGDHSANCFDIVAGVLNGQVFGFTNNTSTACVINESVRWRMGGAGAHPFIFAGGDWNVNNHMRSANSSAILVQLQGPGTMTWTGTNNANANYPDLIGTPVRINGGTMIIKSSDLLNATAGGPAIVHNGTLLKYDCTPATGIATGPDTIPGAISGSGPIQVNAGTVTFAGASTFTGNISLTGGELIAGSTENEGVSGPLGQGGTISFNGGTLGWNLANAFDYSSRFDTSANQVYNLDTGGSSPTFATGLSSSGGSLTKLGGGTLTLAGPSTYTGPTTVNVGELLFQGTKSGGANITVADGATLGVVENGSQITPGTLTLGASTGVILEFNNVTNQAAATLAPTNLVSAGTVTINVNSGRFFSIGEILPLFSWTSGTAPAVTLGFLAGAGGHLVTNINNVEIDLVIDNPPYIWTGLSSGTWDTITMNWVRSGLATDWINGNYALLDDTGGANTNLTLLGLITPTNVTINNSLLTYAITNSAGNVLGGPGSLTKNGTGTLTLPGGTNTYTGVTTLGGGVLDITVLANGGTASDIGAANNSASNIVLNGGTLQYTGPGVSIDRLFSVGASGGTIDDEGATAALIFNNSGSLGMSGNGPRAFTLTGPGTFGDTLACGIANHPAGTALTKNGSGLWILTGTNGYANGTTVNGGVLQVGAQGPSGTLGSGNISMANGAGIDFQRTGTLLVPGGISGNGSVTNDGTGTVILANNNSYSGGTTINAGTLQVGNGSGSGSLNFSGAIVDNTLLVFNTSGTFNYGAPGLISGPGNVIVEGGGFIKAIGPNTYTGWTLIAAGTTFQPIEGQDGGMTTSAITNNGILRLVRQDAVITYPGPISGSGKVQNGANNVNVGVITLTGTNTYTGGTFIGDNTLVLGDGVSQGAWGNGGNFVFTNNFTIGQDNTRTLIFNHPDDFTFTNTITTNFATPQVNLGIVQQNGSGTITFTRNNTYGGGTVVNAGAIVIGNGGSSGSIGWGPLALTSGNPLLINRSGIMSQTIDNISGAADIYITGGPTVTFNGANNTYSGATYVTNGTLIVNGTNVTSLTHVYAGGLGGAGTFSGPITLDPGTTFSPGLPNQVGTLTVQSNLTLDAASIVIDINKLLSPSNDIVNVAGTLTRNVTNGTLTVHNRGPQDLLPGDKFTLFSQPLTNGGGITVTGGRATWVNNLAFDGSISVDTVITTVPTLIYTNNGGTNLVFSWSDPYNSFKLQSQTNTLKVGISNNWVNYPNGGTPPVTVPIVKTNPAVFFRIISIP